ERSNRILLVSCRKDYLGQLIDSDRFEDSESVHLRHLHIEEYNVGVLLSDHRDGLFAVTAFADNFDIVIISYHSTNKFAGERLVVSDQSSNRRILHVSCCSFKNSASRRKGISITTVSPPSLRFISSKRKSDP